MPPSSDTQPSALVATRLSAADEEEAAALVAQSNAATISFWSRLSRPPEFRPVGPSPVILSTWMKSGTTLLQQLVYQLMVASGRVPTDPSGSDHDEICAVVPFIEIVGTGGPAVPCHIYIPTAWKTHADPTELTGPNYADARYIVVVREGRSAFRSYSNYAPRFYGGLEFPEKLRPRVYELLFRSFFLRADVPGVPPIDCSFPVRPWFDYVKAWRDCPVVEGRTLFIIFEDMVSDMHATIRMIARFLGLSITDAVVDTVAARCSKEHMVGNPKFNSRIAARLMGLDISAGVRVRPDSVKGFDDVLPQQTAADYARKFKETLGVETYEELCEQLRDRSRKVLG